MARKPGIGRIKRKPRRIKSYVGPDVGKAMEAVGLVPEPSALDVIATQLTRLADAAEKLVAKASEPAPARQPRKTKAEPALVVPDYHGRADTVDVTEPDPAPPGRVVEKPLPPPPTLDELRAAAVAYAGKHGKDALVALLQKFNPEGKLSTIPENNLSPCLAALKMGMVD